MRSLWLAILSKWVRYVNAPSLVALYYLLNLAEKNIHNEETGIV